MELSLLVSFEVSDPVSAFASFAISSLVKARSLSSSLDVRTVRLRLVGSFSNLFTSVFVFDVASSASPD